MEKVKIKIKGIVPLLMHKYNFDTTKEKAKRKDEQYSVEKDAQRALYYEKSIGCYVPSTWIEACLRQTASDFKQGKKTYKNTILSSVFCEQEKIPLNKKTYDEIDVRAVVIQRNRIAKGRPKFNTWELEFVLCYDETRIKKDILKQILEEAGAAKGIGDYRPKFGRFKVLEFK